MKKLEIKKNIFWDFDGVIFDSHSVRNKGFLKMLKEYPKEEVELLMDYHKQNGGLSRYAKFRYFFETIRGERISVERMEKLTDGFSEIMRNNLSDRKYLIDDSFNFIQQNHKKFRMHIISGSDGEELRYLCKAVGLDSYFVSIKGSPTPKVELVAQVLSLNSYKTEETVLIGDSINDFDAAENNNIDFLGYNNPDLRTLGAGYIHSFNDSKNL